MADKIKFVQINGGAPLTLRVDVMEEATKELALYMFEFLEVDERPGEEAHDKAIQICRKMELTQEETIALFPLAYTVVDETRRRLEKEHDESYH